MIYKQITVNGGKKYTSLSCFGKDVPESFQCYMDQECTIGDSPAVIIGLEQNEFLGIWFFIVLCLVSEQITYVETTNTYFLGTLKPFKQ